MRSRSTWILRAAALLTVLTLSGCGSIGPAPVDSRDGYGPAPEGYYRIRPGDTLSGIAYRKRVGLHQLARWNGLEPPYPIYAGRLLRVEPPQSEGRATAAAPPAAVQGGGAAVTPSPSKHRAKVATAKDTAAAGASGLAWRWPLRGGIAQTFRRGDRTRQGIRISGRAGEKVAAAEAGTVVYSGSGLKGYGNLIIVKHNNKYLSVYGFNSRLLVAEGARVKRGQSVAEVGQAPGGAYLLHFEIRRDGTAVNPLAYLPASG